MSNNTDKFDECWAKLAAIPSNQFTGAIYHGNGCVILCKVKKPWYGMTEKQCLAFIKSGK